MARVLFHRLADQSILDPTMSGAVNTARRRFRPARSLHLISVGAIWRFLQSQAASLWLICTYLFFEYVRPQQIYYTAIDVLPWGLSVLALCLVAFSKEQRTRLDNHRGHRVVGHGCENGC